MTSRPKGGRGTKDFVTSLITKMRDDRGRGCQKLS